MANTNDDVIIVGSLNDKELRDSIDELVEYVGKKTNVMAESFREGLDKMKLAMKDFAITQKVSIDLMQEAWKKMSTSFDAMVAAHSTSTGGGTGSGKPVYDDNTVGHLEEIIRLENKRRKEMYLGSEELSRQNRLIAEQKDKLKRETTRSLKLSDVLGMDESSFDAITKKMSALKKATWSTKEEQNNIIKAYQRLREEQNKLLSNNAKMARSNNYLAQSFGYIRNRIVYALTLGAVTRFVKDVYEIRGQYELLERSLGVLINDMGKGSEIFRQLNAMALKSPFTLIDLAGAAKQLTAYNFKAEEVVDTTRRLADISSALGVPMERLVYNLGQIRAQNVLNARDARDFANAGLPIVSMLADMYTQQKKFGDEVVTTSHVYEMMSKKMVSYKDVLKVIYNVTDEGGKFFDFQAKQASTLRVQLANLTLAYNNMLDSIGKENQGLLSGGVGAIKSLVNNWRSLQRVLMTVIFTYGTYKSAAILASLSTTIFGNSIVATTSRIYKFSGAMGVLIHTAKAIPFVGWVTILSSLISYFWLFNNSAGELSQKLKDINDKFTSLRKNATDLFVSALKTDNLNVQIQNLKELVEYAKSELGITIPVNIQDVDAEKVAQQLRETKDKIDDYLDFAQAFAAESASNEYFNEYFTKFGDVAQNSFNGIYNSINTVIEGLQKLKETGNATSKELAILQELIAGKKEDESKLEYLQRLISLYEQLGIIGKKEFTHSFFGGLIDNTEVLEANQENALNRIQVKNKQVFSTMLQDVHDFYSNASTAAYQLERTVNSLAKRININSIPEDERTLKLSAAINEEAAANNWNEFAKQYARQVANQKFKTNIELNDESKKVTEDELKDWQKRLQQWADKNGITLNLTFNANTTELDAANEALKNLQTATQTYETLQRKLAVGTSTQKEVDKALKAKEDAYKVAVQAGADLSKLNTGKGRKDVDVVAEALKQEIQLINDMRSNYDKLRKAGVSDTEAITLASKGYEMTILRINSILQKFGIDKFNAGNFAGKNVRELLDNLTKQRDALLASGKVKTSSLKDLDVMIQKLTIDAKTFDMKKITDGLNNELGKLKDEYELAVELDANPELEGMFLDMFGIDKSTLSSSIDDYMFAVQSAFEKARQQLGYGITLDVFKANDDDWKTWGDWVGVSGEALDKFKAKFVDAQNVVKKTVQDTIKQTKDLEYNISDTQGKIAIETAKLKKLQADMDDADTKSKDEALGDELRAYYATQKKLLGMQVQDQEDTIARLGDEILQTLPTYKKLFDDISEHSSVVTRKIAKEWKEALDNAVKNANGTYTITDPNDQTKTTTITGKQYGTQQSRTNQELNKTRSSFAKIKEAFTKREDGEVDYAKGMELVAGEARKAADGLNTVADIVSALGGDDETVETINDIATSMNGLATATEGFGQIASGDYIGGTVNVIKGTWEAVSTWFDNDNKKIDQQIKDSEFAIKRLENQYKRVEEAINSAYGTAVIGAKRAAIANKELQLVELKRQLALEQSRDSKDRDRDKIEDLNGRIMELEYDIKHTTEDIINDFLGLSSVGDAMESLMDGLIAALRNGEDAMAVFDESVDNMIVNMVKKMYVTKILQPWFEQMWNSIQEDIDKRSKSYFDYVNNAMDAFQVVTPEEGLKNTIELAKTFNTTPEEYANNLRYFSDINDDILNQLDTSSWEALTNSMIAVYRAGGMTNDDILRYAELLRSGQPVIEESMEGLEEYLRQLGLMNDKDKNLSALQQGIQGITEDTAGALEAYLNIVSQRMFEHGQIFAEIRDTLTTFDFDAQLGTLGVMLLQLQNSYQVQQAIQSRLDGWNNASSQAVRVEII